MADRLLEAYESVPYDSKPIRLTHVSSLEMIARLHGLTPPSSVEARVLELGCASGGNLIPMAAVLPRAKFVGVDLAPSQVARGLKTIEALGLGNIELHAMSIADITPAFGEFDYIICHGVYSWVPPQVQEAILRVCSENLSATGIAYVSYNVNPGWRMRAMIRDMLMFHDNPDLPPKQRVERARTFMKVMVDVADAKTVYPSVLAQEVDGLKNHADVNLLHEQLEPYNEPLQFNEFARRSAQHGLRYVGDALLGANLIAVPDWIREIVGDARATDVVRVQQYLDFAKGTAFRRSVLCRASVVPNATLDPSALRNTHFVMRAAPVPPSEADAKASGGTAESYRSPDGAALTTNNPIVLTALRILHRAAPAVVSYADIERRVLERLQMDRPPGMPGDERVRGLDSVLLQCAMAGVIHIIHAPVSIAPSVSERPAAAPFIRRSAAEGNMVGTLRHYVVEVSGFERLILMHLDGTNARHDLVSIVEQAIRDGNLTTAGEALGQAALCQAVDAALRRFFISSMLEA